MCLCVYVCVCVRACVHSSVCVYMHVLELPYFRSVPMSDYFIFQTTKLIPNINQLDNSYLV